MITIAGYQFNGSYGIGDVEINRAAVYVILDNRDSVVDVGQSGEVGTRLENHDRKPCWDRNGGDRVAIKWMPSSQYSREDREKIERSIRAKEDPPCGEE